jgi:cytoskeletal protein RodZ
MIKLTTKKITQRATVGERLAKARKRKKLPLSCVESLTRIKRKYLEDIEKNQFENLPNDVYIRGFLQTYAQLVNLDPVDILKQYQLEQGKSFQEKKTDLALQNGVKSPKLILTTKPIIIILVLILISGFLGLLFYQVKGFAAAPSLEISKPLQENISIQDDNIEIAGKTDPGAELFINDQSVGIELDGTFSESISLRSGVNTLHLIAKNKIGSTTKHDISISASFPEVAGAQALSIEQTPQTSAPTQIVQNGLKINITANPNSVWLKVTADGKVVFSGVMLANSTKEFKADSEIVLTSGNAGSTHILLNDIDKGVLGREAEMKKDMKYTLDMVK